MANHMRQLAGTLALATLVACTPTPTTSGTGATPRPPKPTATNAPASAAPITPAGSLAPGASPAPIVAPLTPLSPAPSGQPAALAVLAGKVMAPPALVTAAGGTLISDKGLGIIANNGGGLVANNGSNIIANNGGGLVSNNGGGLTSKTKYALAQAPGLAQVALQGVPVTLVDAAGNPVVGADGEPVVAVTDDQGRYAFAGVRPELHLVVRAELPKVGALARIAAPGVADAPLDVASTLATAYILDKFVATQADRNATLARLPADVEAETVLIAGQAAAKDAPPVTLASAELVARVDALRAADPTLDAQLDKVKKLLILAGVSNLGDGEVATGVVIQYIKAIWPRPDGRTYLHATAEQMIWRLDPDGRLRAVAGPAASGPGAGVSVGQAAMVADAAGRLVGAGREKGVWRLTPGASPADLAVEALAPELADVLAVCPLEGDAVLAFARAADGKTLAWRLAPGAAPVQVGGGPVAVQGVEHAVRMADGTIRLDSFTMFGRSAHGFDPATGATSDLGADLGLTGTVRLGPDGALYHAEGGAVLVRPAAGGPAVAVPELAPADLTRVTALAAAAGGGLYVARNESEATVLVKTSTLHLLEGAARTHLAGQPAGAPSATPSAGASEGPAALQRATSFAVEPGGDLLVIDNAVLYRVKPGGGKTALVAGTLTDPSDGATFRAWEVFPRTDGGCTLGAVQNDAALGGRHAIFHVKPDGGAVLVKRLDTEIRSAAHGPDGGGIIAFGKRDLSLGEVYRIAPDGAITTLLPPSKDAALTRVWYDGARPVTAKVTGGLFTEKYAPTRHEVDGTTTALPEVAKPPLLIDMQGRVYTGGATVVRTDPATGAAVILAGKGGRTFTGDGVDDGLGEATQLIFAPGGDLYVLDAKNKQIKRIPADQL